MYEYHNKETKKEWVQEREIDKEDIMPPTKMGIKQLAKQSMLDPTILEKSTKFYILILGVAKACFTDNLSKKKFFEKRGLN